ncbi:hypothetical protein [Rasiella sp. SM2506]|uniref:hypothetical protein n=1 Tax=Rasiella sp. SM2506 TaxID=3423914 RepID=UPI003D79092E
MEISFRTEEESNKAQEAAFLALTPRERFYAFFDMIRWHQQLPNEQPEKPSKNFILKLPRD